MAKISYDKLNLKIPKESEGYKQCSDFIIQSTDEIIAGAIKEDKNKIIINTNLRYGIPMENVNKIAGPFVEAWAYETFTDVLEDEDNKYKLMNVEAGERLNMADVILQFKREQKQQTFVTGYLDVKATSKDIENSGKPPNITSFNRTRTMYLTDPDYIFIVLSLKHKVFSTKDQETKMMRGVMEVVDYNTYDLKYISKSDISYNPALGSGQLQIRDIHYVELETRNVWEFCKLLDQKFLNSRKGFDVWYEYALQHGWVKDAAN